IHHNCVNQQYVQNYLDEFCYKFNRRYFGGEPGKNPKEDKKEGTSCGEKFCIKKGDKSELIREINIRLAGFGGNVPTDEFTDRTEKMIKQFQRDYMKSLKLERFAVMF
ncbi:hypothetical protein NTJ12_002577, partial [Flavobacterium psychrophilum]|nr:hypothetical protein [Flavobacterium psychrophilum]